MKGVIVRAFTERIFGGISKLPGPRRRPWRVRITIGYEYGADGKARQQYATLGYYATREEAMLALAEYNKNPLSLEKGITFAEIYKRWSEEQFKAKPSTKRIYSAAYAAVPGLHDKEFRKLKRNDLQEAVDKSGKNYPTLKMVRLLMNQLYKYASQNDLVERDYSQFVDIARYKNDKEEEEMEEIHTDIKPEEIAELWKRADDPAVQEVLMLIYSGLRVGEFLALTAGDVDIEARFVYIRRSKTAAGRRKVPIHSRTLSFWKDRKEQAGEFLIPVNAASRPDPRYKRYKERFFRVFDSAGLQRHLPHDTRHTTASMLHAAGVNPYEVKLILGHATADITEGIYTHVSDEKILASIEKI